MKERDSSTFIIINYIDQECEVAYDEGVDVRFS